MTTCGEGGMSMAGVALREAWKSVELNARWMQNPAGANQTRLDSDRIKFNWTTAVQLSYQGAISCGTTHVSADLHCGSRQAVAAIVSPISSCPVCCWVL